MNFLSRKERNKLIYKIRSLDWSDEEEVFDLAVTLCFLSVRLRSEILRRSEFDDESV